MVTIETSLIEAKKDERGRRITPRTEREAFVKAYRASGLTQRAFAQREHLNYMTFTSWVQEFLSAARATVKFAEVSALSGPASPVEAQLPSGVVVRGDAAEVARLLGLLRC